ncbi:MAG: formylmethanofuran dehydrogenase [Chloroflexi bacterium]|nr:formylmethanofuran dehydrogenase [Chloroflexota bacterium]
MDLKTLLDESAKHHRHRLCPRQVLGVCMGLYAGELLGVALPQADKRVFCFVETDGCLTDGIAVTTGCAMGRRTMYLMDYGKTAATFVDTQTQCAWRVTPTPLSRQHALAYAPTAPDRWHAQLEAYQIMPTHELLLAQPVRLTVDLNAILSKHGMRVVCEQCGEDVINERFVICEGRLLCRPCTDGAYYVVDAIPIELPQCRHTTAHL